MIAGAISGAPDRWAIVHLTIALGVGLVLLAAVAIRRQFRIAGEHRWSGIGIPLLIVGGVLQGAVVGAEITLAAVVNSRLDVVAGLIEAETWTRPLFMGAMALFVMGWLSFAVAFRKVPILPAARNRLAIALLVAILIATFIPQTTGNYLLGISMLVVSWLVGGWPSVSGSARRDRLTRSVGAATATPTFP